MRDKLVWCLASNATVRGGSTAIILKKQMYFSSNYIIDAVFLILFSLFLKNSFLSSPGFNSNKTAAHPFEDTHWFCRFTGFLPTAYLFLIHVI